MDTIRNLIARFWTTGVLFLSGFLVIIYIGLGINYLQQGAQQEELDKQIVRLSLIVARPMPSGEELLADYEKITTALAPMTNSAAIAIIVGIAEKSGIDIDPDAGKFRIPTAVVKEVKEGVGTYQLLSFSNIHVEGDYDNVMAFISDLDSGETLKTMVLKRAIFKELKPEVGAEETARVAEFRRVELAVMAMMDDTGLSEIPNPMDFAGGVAINLMGDDLDTEEAVEGFPDITTTAADRGYSGNATPRVGYVLYYHDKISTDNATQFETVSYIDVLTTDYYYTCEADGTVRQFDGAYVATAREYPHSEESKIGVVATVDVDIYTKLEE